MAQGLPHPLTAEDLENVQHQDALGMLPARRGEKIAKQYFLTTPHVESGHLLEHAEAQSPVYREISLEGIPWQHIVSTQPGVELSLEDYLRDRGSPASLPFSAQMQDVKGVLKIVLTQSE